MKLVGGNKLDKNFAALLSVLLFSSNKMRQSYIKAIEKKLIDE